MLYPVIYVKGIAVSVQGTFDYFLHMTMSVTAGLARYADEGNELIQHRAGYWPIDLQHGQHLCAVAASQLQARQK